MGSQQNLSVPGGIVPSMVVTSGICVCFPSFHQEQFWVSQAVNSSSSWFTALSAFNLLSKILIFYVFMDLTLDTPDLASLPSPYWYKVTTQHCCISQQLNCEIIVLHFCTGNNWIIHSLPMKSDRIIQYPSLRLIRRAKAVHMQHTGSSMKGCFQNSRSLTLQN